MKIQVVQREPPMELGHTFRGNEISNLGNSEKGQAATPIKMYVWIHRKQKGSGFADGVTMITNYDENELSRAYPLHVRPLVIVVVWTAMVPSLDNRSM